MPEIPDLVVYLERLEAWFSGKRCEKVRVKSPFVIRTFDPAISAIEGRRATSFERLGKRLVFGFESDLFVVIHLMISGRLRVREKGAAIGAKTNLLALDFENGSLLLTEASSKKRASVHVVRGRSSLEEFQRGGLEVLTATLPEFREALVKENRTLKRALTDPRLFSGIGNAYSDEILHRARLSPVKRTQQLNADEIERLYHASRDTLSEWIERLRAESGSGFPEKVTAFRPEMAVHGRYKKPCPVCGTSVQRIVYAQNEVNYCPSCQTGGKLLADRALSRLLRSDWPRSIEELEERLGRS